MASPTKLSNTRTKQTAKKSLMKGNSLKHISQRPRELKAKERNELKTISSQGHAAIICGQSFTLPWEPRFGISVPPNCVGWGGVHGGGTVVWGGTCHPTPPHPVGGAPKASKASLGDGHPTNPKTGIG